MRQNLPERVVPSSGQWIGALIRTPTRIIVIIAIAVSLGVSQALPDETETETGGVAGALLLVGGICILGVLLAWRWFFRGKAVANTLIRIYYPEVVVALRDGTYAIGPLFSPGWHPDPIGHANYRWWNGVEWTDRSSQGQSLDI